MPTAQELVREMQRQNLGPDEQAQILQRAIQEGVVTDWQQLPGGMFRPTPTDPAQSPLLRPASELTASPSVQSGPPSPAAQPTSRQSLAQIGASMAIPTALSAGGQALGAAVGGPPGAFVGETLGDIAGYGANVALGLEPFRWSQLALAAASPGVSRAVWSGTKRTFGAAMRRTRAAREMGAETAHQMANQIPERLFGEITQDHVNTAYDAIEQVGNRLNIRMPAAPMKQAIREAVDELGLSTQTGLERPVGGYLRRLIKTADTEGSRVISPAGELADDFTPRTLQRQISRWNRERAAMLRPTNPSARAVSEAAVLTRLIRQGESMLDDLAEHGHPEIRGLIKQANRSNRILRTKESFEALITDATDVLEGGAQLLNLRKIEEALVKGNRYQMMRDSLDKLGIRAQMRKELDILAKLYPKGIMLPVTVVASGGAMVEIGRAHV